VEYLHNLASNRLDNSISRLEGIIRVPAIDIIVVGEEVVKGIEDIVEVVEA
jgi:hypothetical protein